jgi:hypothetical protein
MNGIKQLIGRRVIVRANDFVDRPLDVLIRAVEPEGESVLLEFSPPYEVNGVFYRHAVGRTRLVGEHIDSLSRNGLIGSAITWVPDARFDSRSPFDTSWWRGGAAAIADMVLDNKGGRR